MEMECFMPARTFHNPILKGFYPDPSICRAGDAYYMVTSSFYYFPGLPVFRSWDLVHWQQIGHAISRPEQLDFRNCDNSEGLWAATIRFHEGRFYIICTLDVNGRADRTTFIVTADRPEGPWSDAVAIRGVDGIDPSLYFEEDGSIWFCGNHVPDPLLYPSHKQILLGELDAHSFQLKEEPQVILDGALDYSLYLEAPHIYRRGGWYYLMAAEGGTQTNHAVNLYRSPSIHGPYEPCPHNPIVSNRGIRMVNALGISVTGHGDLVETQKGEWYMALLGIRPYDRLITDYRQFGPRMWIREPDRNKNAQFNLGRETFLVPMAWEDDGWLVVDNENGLVNPEERRPDLPWKRECPRSQVDHFEEDTLDMSWTMQRPPKEPFWSLTEREGFLRLYLKNAVAEGKASCSTLLRRQQHNNFLAKTAMEFEPTENGQEAGLLLTQNERFSYLMVKEMREGRVFLSCYLVLGGKRQLLSNVPAPQGRVILTIEGSEGFYSFYYGRRERELLPLTEKADASFLSTLVADGYVGVLMGPYASTGKAGPDSNDVLRDVYADFDWFSYELIEE